MRSICRNYNCIANLLAAPANLLILPAIGSIDMEIEKGD